MGSGSTSGGHESMESLREPALGLKIKRFPARLFALSLWLNGIFTAALVGHLYYFHSKNKTDRVTELRIQEVRGTILHLDEVLTMSARMAASTGDPRWEKRYRQFEGPLDATIKEARRGRGGRCALFHFKSAVRLKADHHDFGGPLYDYVPGAHHPFQSPAQSVCFQSTAAPTSAGNSSGTADTGAATEFAPAGSRD